MLQGKTGRVFEVIGRDLIGEILYFPIWWYSKGVLQFTQIAWGKVMWLWGSLGLRILIKSYFKPMFGDRSFWGRSISIVMRTIELVFNLAIISVWAGLMISILLIWLALPAIAVWQLIIPTNI